MEAQPHRTTHDYHRYEEDPNHNGALPSGMEGEGEAEHNHHGEKKSVLKKVKDKAKKIKDKIKHSGHAHDEEEYDDEDEETVVASGGHAAPIVNEDAFISGTNLPKQTGLNLGNQTTPLEDLQNPSVKGHAGVRDPHGHNTRNEVHPSIGNDPVLIGNAGVKDPHGHNTRNEVQPSIGNDPVLIGNAGVRDPHGHNTRNEVHPSIGNDPVLIGNAGVRDPHGPNMRTEVHPGIGDDPVTSAPMEVDHPYNPDIDREHAYSSAGDVGSGPGKMARLPMEAPKTDLWDPLPASTAAIDSEPQRVNVAEPMAKIGPLTDMEKDPHSPGGFSPPNYQTKVVDPTGKGGAEAEVAPLDERLGNLHVDDKSEEKSYTGSHDQFAPEPTLINEQERSYTGSHDQSAPDRTPINEQERSYTGSHDQSAADRTPINEQERSYTGSHDQFAPEPTPTKEQFNLEAKSFDAESPESMPRDTVAGKISAATSLIADKASSAKNMVASKLGYGNDQSQVAQEPPKTTALGSVSEYGYKVAEKLAPVYDKAAGAGSAIMSKVQGGGGEGVVAKESDKGVSVQEYLAEKFSPGDEDKELSKVITDAIHRKKGRAAETGEDEAVPVPVKETIRIEAVASNEKAAAGVVDRVKGAIGSWLGKSPGEGIEKEEVSRVQEAGNN